MAARRLVIFDHVPEGSTLATARADVTELAGKMGRALEERASHYHPQGWTENLESFRIVQVPGTHTVVASILIERPD